MSVTFKPAVRENVPLLIGLGGASGSGKTFTALELATGVAEAIGKAKGRTGRIGFIDTERRRGLHYADRFEFLHAELNPPFRPRSYMDAISAAEGAGVDVLVIDSFSHEWEGEGGVKEWADEIQRETQNRNEAAKWNIPKSGPDGHKRLVNQMLAAKPHIIICLRAEEKMRMEDVPQFNDDGTPKMWKGKQSTRTVITAAKDLPLKERWVPICEKRFPFELTTSLLLTPDQPGVPVPLKLQEQHMPAFPEGQRISREAGRYLAEWSMGGAPAAASVPSGPTIDQVRADLDAAADEGTASLERAWKSKTTAPFRDQIDLAPLKTRAANADRTPEPEYQAGAPDGYSGV